MESNQKTARELSPAIGASVAVRFEQTTFFCIVRDAKNVYGRVRLLVEPISGYGAQWIELTRLVPAAKTNAFAAEVKQWIESREVPRD